MDSINDSTKSEGIIENDDDIQYISDHSEESDEDDPDTDWSGLPAPTVEHIYSFLNRADQGRMSLVCRRWSKEYSSPSLWRTIKFYLPEHHCSSQIYPEVRFSQTFGHLFKHVEVVCKRVRTHLIDDIFIQLKIFLNNITNNSQLVSIKFINMIKYFSRLEEEDYQTLLRNTISCLTAQRSLKSLEFHETYYRREEGAELLKEVSDHNPDSLSRVVIKGFVTDREETEEPHVMSLYSSLSRNFINWKYFQTDYSQLLEIMIQNFLETDIHLLSNGTKGKLALLDINCEGSKRLRFQGIPPVAWKTLRNLCPNLKVHMTLVSSTRPNNEFGFFIVENMPLQQLVYHQSVPLESRNLEIGDIFQHLQRSKCHEHLENLTIVWMSQVTDLSHHLVPFLQIASKLKTLQIFLRHPVSGIDTLFQSWTENRPSSLESAHLSICRVRREEDYLNIMRIADEYTPLLQVLGLNVILVADTL